MAGSEKTFSIVGICTKVIADCWVILVSSYLPILLAPSLERFDNYAGFL